jgi:hypothetical protein
MLIAYSVQTSQVLTVNPRLGMKTVYILSRSREESRIAVGLEEAFYDATRLALTFSPQ